MTKYLSILMTLTLSACGFTPMHAPGPGANGTNVFNNIQVDMVVPNEISDREGAFWLQQALYDRLGADGGTHILKLQSSFRRKGIGVTPEDIDSRYDVSVRINYTLSDTVSGDMLDKGSVTVHSTFGSSQDPYSRRASEKDTLQNIAKTAADRLLTRVAAYYADQ